MHINTNELCILITQQTSKSKRRYYRILQSQTAKKIFKSYYCNSHIFYLNQILVNTLAPNFYLKKWLNIFYLIGFEYISYYLLKKGSASRTHLNKSSSLH